MNFDAVGPIATTLLYEGYILYPYTLDATKNQQRWTFGGLYPEDFVTPFGAGSDSSLMQTEVLVRGSRSTLCQAEIRFLRIIECRDQAGKNWQEAAETRLGIEEFILGDVLGKAKLVHFNYPATILDDSTAKSPAKADLETQEAKVIFREQRALSGEIEISAVPLADTLFKLSVRIKNLSRCPERERSRALLQAMASTHTLLGLERGKFISLTDFPPDCADFVAQCQNTGTWPVLVGDAALANRVFSSPIILYDYPQVAPQSPGNLFDGTEIDEILSLRILTLSEAEKQQLRSADAQTRALLERTEALSESELLNLHAVLQPTQAAHFRPGDQVRLRPKRRADIFDLALAGCVATVESIERDFENRAYFTVTVNDDPGRDLGAEGKPGHRFFFFPDEVEAL